jgi:DivIVA domain-containing protein
VAAVGHTRGGRRAPADAGGAGPVAAAELSVGRGGMGIVGTALLYLLVVTVVAAAFFGVAALVFGRGEELAPLAPDATPTRLPSHGIRGEDIRELRFPQAVRGYRMTEVDWVLDRLAEEIERLTQERDELAARVEPSS